MKYKSFFNMIEVTLSLAVVGIGVAGIMALFPVAVQSSKNAIGDNFSADTADQFMHLIRRMAQADWNTYAKSIPDTPNKDDLADENWKSSPVDGTDGLLYEKTSKPGIFRILQKSGSVIDFDAVMCMWRSRPIVPVYTGSAWAAWPDATKYEEHIVGLNVEISWPTAKPYEKREKRYFYLVLSKSN
ncbi:MAG: hypothetical protein BWY74_04051 [Firmicutes bacterium ADurb.Bin419]|nr:MAG: hypothetical protein BWY74_04051 [Firmicutes bacterium ADurb.Bin419]